MHTITHFLVGWLFAFLFGLSIPLTILFVAASVLIDSDHIVEIKVPHKKKFKKEHIFNVFSYRKENYLSPQKSMHLFHTFEVIFLIFLLSFFYSPLFWIAIAFILHLGLDAVGNIKNRNFGNAGGKDWIKYWFLFYYLKKGSIYNKENF